MGAHILLVRTEDRVKPQTLFFCFESCNYLSSGSSWGRKRSGSAVFIGRGLPRSHSDAEIAWRERLGEFQNISLATTFFQWKKRLPLIKIQLVGRLCGSLCMAGGRPCRFEKGPSLEPRLYKLSSVLGCCTKHQFTNVRTGSRAGVGKRRLASSCA